MSSRRPEARSPGREVEAAGQVDLLLDWADFGTLKIGRAERPLMAFVVVLSWSRRLVARFYLGAQMPVFLAGHVYALGRLGGVPRELLYDNLKSAVVERRGDAIRFNATLLNLASLYRFAPKACAPRRGNEKGRVERAIRYIREAFFAARVFDGLDDLSAQLEAFCDGPAMDRRWPEDQTRTVRDAFTEEQLRLLPSANSCGSRPAITAESSSRRGMMYTEPAHGDDEAK